MKLLLLCLYIFAPLSAAQTVLDYVNNINTLTLNAQTYVAPTDYSEFYCPFAFDAGLYGDFDFIIVGAGSAGSVLANRLSEIKDWEILLLEAGLNETAFTDLPALPMLSQFTPYNWGYKSTPQTNCCQGMVDNRCEFPRGKALGGTSVINYMMYVRGNKEDYNKWAADGNPGWSYDEVLPYFKKSEKSSLIENVDEDYHGTNGTLSVENVRHFTTLGQVFLEGAQELGRVISDYNGEVQMAYSKLQSNTINGRRCSANKAFLSPVLGRPNLKVQRAFVTKLIINDLTKTADGVEFLVGCLKYYATARKEVILSAGAVGSPQILMLSGIGPKDHLESLNIPLKQNLAVGQYLADHPFVIYPFKTTCPVIELLDLPLLVTDYLNGYGFLTAAGDIQVLGYFNTIDESSLYPNIEHILAGYFDYSTRIVQLGLNIKPDIYDAFFGPYQPGGPVLVSVLLNEKSRGTITLKSASPFDHPLIDLNYFSEPEDMENLLKGFKDFIKITKTAAMQKCNVEIVYNSYGPCTLLPSFDDYLRCHITHLATTLYHPTGTCKMGPADDPQAVVDSRLKVRNIKNLRVIDASIIPSPIAGHTNGPTCMIAEKGADLIKKDWNVC